MQAGPTLKPQRTLLLAIATTSLAAVAAALVSQHTFDMQPCPWCVLQRLVFVAIALATLPALLVPKPLLRRVVAFEVLVLALCGAAAALWQHLVAASSTSCKLTLADRIVAGLGLDSALPSVFAAYASCADAAVRIAGVPYEFFSLALFVAMAVAAVQLLSGHKDRRS